jgi:hypothetical protein
LRADLDQVEALAPEREALWSRLQATTFLTDDEKRTAIGYSPKVGLKYTPDQPRDDNGRWTDGGAGAGAGEIPLSGTTATFVVDAQPANPQVAVGPLIGPDGVPVTGAIADVTFVADKPNQPGYPVDILQEDLKGGHTFAEHVGKSESYLEARITGSRPNVLVLFRQ